jgi:hypothetical protein
MNLYEFFLITPNVRVYDQLRFQCVAVSNYTNLGRSVTDILVLYYVSDLRTTNQAIGYTRCCALWYKVKTTDQ